MTDLHHPNIVRYSTCWVEIEASKESDLSSRVKKEFESECRSNNIVEEIESYEESDLSESEASPPINNFSNTSSMAFEWDIGNADSEKSKSPKKADKKYNPKKKKSNTQKGGSALNLKSISKVNFFFLFIKITKTFIEEEEDNHSASNISRTDQSPIINGYKLYLYIQMEYCAGENLRNFLDASKKDISTQKTLRMFRKLLEGVKAIHQRGILHRDLK